jgi:hypothetical protein
MYSTHPYPRTFVTIPNTKIISNILFIAAPLVIKD